MLIGSILATLALTTSVLAVPRGFPKEARAAAPVPGQYKQTSRNEILRRTKRKMNRPARRAIISQAPAPQTIGFYNLYGENSGVQVTATPDEFYTIPATTNFDVALQSCVGGATTPQVAFTYSISDDQYFCAYYNAVDVTTGPNDNVGDLAIYLLSAP